MATPVSDSVVLPPVDGGNGTLTDEFLNVMVQDSSWQFSGAHVITWSFNLNDPGSPQTLWGGALASKFQDALHAWSDVANITFQQVGTTASQPFYFDSTANIAATLTGDDIAASGGVAFGFFPDAEAAAIPEYPHPGGDVFFDNYFSGFSEFGNGGFALFAFLHELGHALGLKHPFDSGGDASNPTLASLGLPEYDDPRWTVMSYNGVDSLSSGNPSTPMPLDILAIQQIYGANMSFHAGNDHYLPTTQAGERPSTTLWDAGGHDLFDLHQFFLGAVVDLTPGFGYIGSTAGIGTAIAFNVIIEDVLGSIWADTILGNDADNLLAGSDSNDSLVGGLGNDTLDGGNGVDTLSGGAGNDLYVVDSAADMVVEPDASGSDTLAAAGNYSLDGFVLEQGNSFENASGGNAAEHIYGSSGANRITGGLGNDTLVGGDGDDTIDGGFPNANFLGVGGDDDSMVGGAGNDYYFVDSQSDVVVESPGGGTNTVFVDINFPFVSNYVLPDNVQNMVLGTLTENATGNALDNNIVGGLNNSLLLGLAGNDTIVGGGGLDSINGGSGNDWLIGDMFDSLVGGEGNDVYEVTLVNRRAFTLDVSGPPGNHVLAGTSLHFDQTDGRIFVSLFDTVTLFGVPATDRAEISIVVNGYTQWFMQVGPYTAGHDLAVGTFEASTDFLRPPTDGTSWLYLLAYNGPANASGSFTVTTFDIGPLSAGWPLHELDLSFTYVVEGHENAPLTGTLHVTDDLVPVVGDTVVEQADGGIDTLVAFADASITGMLEMPDNVENVTLTGPGAAGIRGNAFANVLTGNGANNLLDGGAGNDSLYGGSGGADTLAGGAGDDTFFIDAAGDTIVENPGEGTDLVRSAVNLTLGANLENLELTVAGLTGNGNELNNVITGSGGADTVNGADGDDTLLGGSGDDSLAGGAGNDSLYGGNGADGLFGGAGNDTYFIDAAGDTIGENPGEGTDLVRSTVNVTLATNVENLVLTGSGDLAGTGNAAANVIVGNAGANLLNGLDGNDTLFGGAGNDSLAGGAGNDAMDGGSGNDSLAGAGGNDFLNGSRGDDTLAGGAGNDKILGAAGGDSLVGGEGRDFLNGIFGDDTLEGGNGDDRLQGGHGNDAMNGGAGNDVFVYSGGDVHAGDADTISGIDAGDVLDITRMLASQLSVGGSALHDGTILPGTLEAGSTNIAFDNETDLLMIDLDGDGSFNAANDFSIQLSGVAALTYLAVSSSFTVTLDP